MTAVFASLFTAQFDQPKLFIQGIVLQLFYL